MSDATGTDTEATAADQADTAEDEGTEPRSRIQRVVDESDRDADGEPRNWQAEAEKWKAIARRHEKTAKTATTAQRELEQLRQSSMTEQERAVEQARAEARSEALKAAGERLAKAEIKAALAGMVDDPGEILDELNLSRYVTEDGEVDDEAVAALKARFNGILGRRAAAQGGRSGHGRSGAQAKTDSVNDQFADAIGGLLSRDAG